MRLLFFNRSYWPDIEATGQLLTELCTDLARDHDVTVIAGQPNFVDARLRPNREVHDGVHIVRVASRRFTKASFLGRALGLASYLALALWAGLRARGPHVIVVETDPPFLGALGAFLKWWHKCRLVFYLQDLFPEVGLLTGRLRPGPLAALLRWATQVGLRHADRIVVLGEDMRRRVLQRGIHDSRIDIISNWADTECVRPVRENNAWRREWNPGGHFLVMYSGNLGLAQNLEHILVAARQLRQEPVAFLFVGEGAAKALLMKRAARWSLDHVRFLPYQPRERLGEALSAADLHLIPLRRGLAGCVVPSKLYGILAAGVPYLAAVDAASEVARVTRTGRAGFLVEPDSPQQLVAAIRSCLEHRQELEEMGARGRKLAETLFERKFAVAKFQQVLDYALAARPRFEVTFTRSSLASPLDRSESPSRAVR